MKARQAVCAYYSNRRISLKPEQITLTTSTSEAYSFLFRLLCDAGSEILVPQPSYPLFDFLAALDDVRIKPVPFFYDHGWQIDADSFRLAVSPLTRAIVLVHPNNPTGHFTKPSEARELAQICREFDLALIVDEVFLDYQFSKGFGGKPRSFAAGLEGVPVFVVSGLSKVVGLPQMKAAWIVAAGPEAVAALDRLEVIADTFLSMNAPVQHALAAWLEGRDAIQNQIRERVEANLAELDLQLSRIWTLAGCPMDARLSIRLSAQSSSPGPTVRTPNWYGKRPTIKAIPTIPVVPRTAAAFACQSKRTTIPKSGK